MNWDNFINVTWTSTDGVTGIIGWAGTVIYLISYLLLTMGKVKASQPVYHWLNLIGALSLIIHAVTLNDYQNLVVNFFWAVIAVIAIYVIIVKRRGQ